MPHSQPVVWDRFTKSIDPMLHTAGVAVFAANFEPEGWLLLCQCILDWWNMGLQAGMIVSVTFPTFQYDHEILILKVLLRFEYMQPEFKIPKEIQVKRIPELQLEKWTLFIPFCMKPYITLGLICHVPPLPGWIKVRKYGTSRAFIENDLQPMYCLNFPAPTCVFCKLSCLKKETASNLPQNGVRLKVPTFALFYRLVRSLSQWFSLGVVMPSNFHREF